MSSVRDLPVQQAADVAHAQAAWNLVRTAAAAPYRHAGRWASHWSRNKLRFDPVFRALLERGDLPHGARVLDLGCGMGLLASLLLACEASKRAGAWPAAWPVRSSAIAYTGIDLMAADVARARAALNAVSHPTAPTWTPQFVCADLREAALPPCDLVVILDVLHYLDHAAQQALLERTVVALRAGAQPPAHPGRLLLRVGDAACRSGFAIGQWVDRAVLRARGQRDARTFGRPLAHWRALLHDLGLSVRASAQSQGTPFANVLLVADLLEGSA